MTTQFVLTDGEKSIERFYSKEIVARIAMEEAFLRERNCNSYLFARTVDVGGKIQEEKEIARRIRSNRRYA